MQTPRLALSTDRHFDFTTIEMIIAIGIGRSMESNPRIAMAVLGLLHVVFAQMLSFFGLVQNRVTLFWGRRSFQVPVTPFIVRIYIKYV